MLTQNFTPIHHVIKNHHQNSHKSAPSKEHMPPSSNENPKEIHIQEVVEHEITDPVVKQHVEVRKETVTIPQDLIKQGVQNTAQPAFANYKNVPIPLPEEKLPEGLQQPLDSSFRWLAELTRYILKSSYHHVKKAHKGVLSAFQGRN